MARPTPPGKQLNVMSARDVRHARPAVGNATHQLPVHSSTSQQQGDVLSATEVSSITLPLLSYVTVIILLVAAVHVCTCCVCMLVCVTISSVFYSKLPAITRLKPAPN